MSKAKEVYRNRLGCIYQDDRHKCYILEYNGHTTTLSVNCFFHLKKQFDQIDIAAVVNNLSLSADITIIAPHSCDRVFALTLSELLEIKDLFAGARVMLELNSIVQERIYAPVLS